jgi:hypothetical protein
VYPKELKVELQRPICISMFAAILFTMAKRQKQSKCPSLDVMVKEVWSTHTMDCYSALKNEGEGWARQCIHVSKCKNDKKD